MSHGKRPDEKNAPEAADYLGYTLKSFYNHISDRIPHRKSRGRLYFKAEDLDAFLEAQSVEHVPEPVQ